MKYLTTVKLASKGWPVPLRSPDMEGVTVVVEDVDEMDDENNFDDHTLCL